MIETYKQLEKWWGRVRIITVFSASLFIGLLLGTFGGEYLYCKNSGLKYFRNYSSNDYMLQPQNWCILQDRLGIIYVANHGGVLEYDGVSWNSILIPNQAGAGSIAMDKSGKIYVGGVNEIGFLEPGPQGQLQYRSLLQNIEEKTRNFGRVWRTHATEEGIYFRTSKYLFRWNQRLKQMEKWEPKKGANYYFNASFACGGKYFIKQHNVGLMQMDNNSLKIIPGGKPFASIRTVFMIASYDDSGEKLLIGTREEGFFIYDGKIMEPFPTEVDAYLKEKKVCHGIRLAHSPGCIAMATLRGGLVIIDIQGKLKYLFTKDSGLRDNNVKYMFEDSQGNLWAALNKGITKIEYLSPLSVYDEYSALPGFVYSMIRHPDGLYAGTSEGLFYLASNNSKFSPIPQISNACWSLLSIGESILAATSFGIFQVQNSTIRKIAETPSYVLFQSLKNPDRIWVGMRGTLASLHLKSNQGKDEWVEEYRHKEVTQEIRTIAEDRDGNLWLGARAAGVIKVEFPGNGTIKDYSIKRYDTSHTLPRGEVQVCWAAGHVMFGTKGGLFRFRGEKELIIPDDTLGKEFSSGLRDVFRVVEDRNKFIWFHAKGRNYQAIPKTDGTYEVKVKPLARIPISAQVNAIYPDPLENAVWFATHQGLIRCDSGLKKDYPHEYFTIIRRILVNGIPRFYNLHMRSDISAVERDSKHSIPVFAYRDRNLRFDFAAPFFVDETRIRYRYFLEGYDNDWSGWHEGAFKDYTNLDSGVYTFHVQAKNVYEHSSGQAVFKFKILPPWYKQWWAFLVYVMILFLAIFLTVRWRSMKLEQEKQKLEQVIVERTKEINWKSQQLEKQTILLKEQADKLKEMDHVKSRFFANISHEFRTPLTMIIGPLENILSGSLPDRMREKLNWMHRNSHRLLMLINRLLDLSRIDSGKMKLRAAPLDIIPFLKGMLASFEQVAREKKLALVLHADEESITCYCDAEKLEDVFGNLLSNAVKFTSEGGKVIVSVRRIMEQEQDFPSGSLEISIQDTGIGIPKEQLSRIFDRFYQVDSKKQKQKGSGIGLALTRELVNLHHGRIDVNSRVGENSGTQFIIRFPLGKDHLKPDEIAAPSEVEIIPPAGRKDKLTVPKGDETNQIENGWEVEWKEDEVIEKEIEPHTVLVVEDNTDMRKFIRESIEQHYTIVEAEDGREGIEKAQTVMPDLIISDIMMPEVDGYELCRTLKNNFKTSHIPVILLTAKASESSVVEGLETGADDYITKPFNTTILKTRIKNLIDLRRQLQEKIQREMLSQPTEIKVSSIDQEFLKKLREIIEDNIDEPELNVEALSEKMDISRVTLNKKIHALTGEKANEFIRSYRLKRGMQLLKDNFGTVLDVAMEVGFSSSAYFTKCFREKFHQLPSAFLGKESK